MEVWTSAEIHTLSNFCEPRGSSRKQEAANLPTDLPGEWKQSQRRMANCPTAELTLLVPDQDTRPPFVVSAGVDYSIRGKTENRNVGHRLPCQNVTSHIWHSRLSVHWAVARSASGRLLLKCVWLSLARRG